MSVSTKEVFALRKAGELEQAYAIAQHLLGENPNDEWNQRAAAWCLIDLIKKSAQQNTPDQTSQYLHKLNSIDLPNDEILLKSAAAVKTLGSAAAPIVEQACLASKAKDHEKALALYSEALRVCPDDHSIKQKIGWEQYHFASTKLKDEKIETQAVKKLLNSYLNLQLERPSLLHSSMLRIAVSIAKEDNFNLMAFLRIWGIENLQEQDFQPYRQDATGKVLPSLAEKLLLKVFKQAIQQGDSNFISQTLPVLEKTITTSPDPIWLTYHKAKALLLLGYSNDAFQLVAAVAGKKMSEYWIWELLGDIKQQQQDDSAMDFYGKALALKPDELYIAKLRLKLAHWFLFKGNLLAAKCELEQIKRTAENLGHNISPEALQLMQQQWFEETNASKTNVAFYSEAAGRAEAVLYRNHPIFIGVVADSFAIKDKPNKKKYRIVFKMSSSGNPQETSVSEQKLKAISLGTGDVIAIKGEMPQDGGKFMVLTIARASTTADPSLVKNFEETCNVSDAGLGFTSSGIFIDANTVKHHNIQKGNQVSGFAIKSYDKKKDKWGWKALKINFVTPS
jgi:tetratricopeptide (TPR) repeat protein